ncbi:hypothetical protein GCM10027033_28540 [Leucobacter ruminantium]
MPRLSLRDALARVCVRIQMFRCAGPGVGRVRTDPAYPERVRRVGVPADAVGGRLEGIYDTRPKEWVT